MKDELSEKIMTELVAIKLKTYSYLMDIGNSHTKAKGTKKCVTKRLLKFKDCKDCLFEIKLILKPKQRFKSEEHSVYTEENDKTALSSNDDKRLQTFGNITSLHMTQMLERSVKQSC